MNEMTGKSLADQLKHYDNWPSTDCAEDREAIAEACLLMDAGSAEIERLTEAVSLRDQMAMAAMSGWLASFGDEDIHPVANEIHPRVARDAYAMADAMLEERDK